MPRQKLKSEFLKNIGICGYELIPIPADASFRTYDRIKVGDKNYILMDSPPEYYDTKPFIDIAQLLKNHSMPAPEIYHVDSEHGFLVLEDFGSTSIKDHLTQNPDKRREIYLRIIELLAEIQKIPSHHLPIHSVEDMLRGMEVFTDWYVPFKTGKAMDANAKDDFLAQWRDALTDLPSIKTLALRDFHAENLMLMNNTVGLLDFQDATQSHPAYDLVSLLEDARYEVPSDLAQEMIDHYLALNPEMNSDEFLRAYEVLGAQRNSRILGVFARKAMRDGARQYLDLIPRVLRYLEVNNMNLLLKGYIAKAV